MNGLLSSLVTPSTSVSTTSIMTNNHQQQNFFIPEKDEIWSGILKTVASSKMVPTKNVLILGKFSIYSDSSKESILIFISNKVNLE
jgi:hypothetical protein